MKLVLAASLCCAAVISLVPEPASAQSAVEYRVLATNKTSTMQRELDLAAAAGFRFGAVMGGETAFGGAEVVVVMHKAQGAAQDQYKLLATSKTSTMQKEMQQAADAGFHYVGQSVFKSMFAGAEVACILERERLVPVSRAVRVPPACDEQDLDPGEGTAGSRQPGVRDHRHDGGPDGHGRQ